MSIVEMWRISDSPLRHPVSVIPKKLPFPPETPLNHLLLYSCSCMMNDIRKSVFHMAAFCWRFFPGTLTTTQGPCDYRAGSDSMQHSPKDVSHKEHGTVANTSLKVFPSELNQWTSPEVNVKWHQEKTPNPSPICDWQTTFNSKST